MSRCVQPVDWLCTCLMDQGLRSGECERNSTESQTHRFKQNLWLMCTSCDVRPFCPLHHKYVAKRIVLQCWTVRFLFSWHHYLLHWAGMSFLGKNTRSMYLIAWWKLILFVFLRIVFPFSSISDILTWQWREKRQYFLPISSSKCPEKRRQLIPHIFTLEKSLVSASDAKKQTAKPRASVDFLPQCEASLPSAIGQQWKNMRRSILGVLHCEPGEKRMTA